MRLLDLWMPPEGAGRPLGCLATTFTFDVDFVEQQCLARYLRLDARMGERDVDDLGALIEREEKLAETPVVVLADRSCNPDARSLRWDVLGVRAPIGVMHAKAALLIWEHTVRVIVSSANLVERSYRSSLEIAVAFDLSAASELSVSFAHELVDALAGVVALVPPWQPGVGPVVRAAAILQRARERIDAFSLPARPTRGAERLAVVATGRGQDDALAQLGSVWQGSPPKHATVMSPFFDAEERASRAAVRLVDVLAKRSASVDFVVALEQLDDRAVLRVPKALVQGLPRRIERRLLGVRQPVADEPRGLHGKLVLLESDAWTVALVGSANFTAPGLGIGGGNVEIGVAIGTRSDGVAAPALRALALAGDPIEGAVEFDPEPDPADRVIPLPAGFVQAIGEPSTPPTLHLELRATELPAAWELRLAAGALLLDADAWRAGGRPSHVHVYPDELPFNVHVTWEHEPDAWQHAALPVNVTDPAALPPPEELRALPLEAVLRALASTRPMHEALVDALEGMQLPRADSLELLDPLRRFSPAGQLLHRTRELSAALSGLQERLQRPAASIDGFRWRVEGQFGPVAIAERLLEQRTDGRTLPGESAFLLAEVALTLSGVDVAAAMRLCPEHAEEAATVLRGAIEALHALAPQDGEGALGAYVRDAFARAGV
ncbi:hypothetical protein [Solirubrobacter soli]|uniref:hypothetical protein n=1 Tax=Solirubrobacter soli TaxID=363832 RepID=UPI0012F8ACF3|nr:hypothetical protein [Solirubrobacter soli]